jgi:hypothetical protein
LVLRVDFVPRNLTADAVLEPSNVDSDGMAVQISVSLAGILTGVVMITGVGCSGVAGVCAACTRACSGIDDSGVLGAAALKSSLQRGVCKLGGVVDGVRRLDGVALLSIVRY